MYSPDKLKELVTVLHSGELIAFPTETVYALAGDAKNLSAVKQIFKIKGRPLDQPLSVLLSRNDQLEAWACPIPPSARRLADYFWPGPLTLILNKRESVLPELVGGGSKIGLRIPDHPIAQAILNAFTGGLAAPSANRTARLSPTCAEHVRYEFTDHPIHIVDEGTCQVGIESTIVDVTSAIPSIIRIGAISPEALQKVVDCDIRADAYAAKQRAQLTVQRVQKNGLQKRVDQYLKQGKTVTVLARYPTHRTHQNLFWMTMPDDVHAYARVLYQCLHDAARHASDAILVESLPSHAAWSGIHAIWASQTNVQNDDTP